MDLVEANITDSEVHGRHPWEKARKEVVTNLIKKLTKGDTDLPLRVLDIGCGDTWLIEQLSETFTNAEFIAVDIAFTDTMLKHYRDKLDPNRFQVFKSLEDANNGYLNEKKVDLVLLLDVIEHIEDDIEFLKWVKTFNNTITQKTNFLITVPAYQLLFSQHDVFLEHYRRYTNKLLTENIQKAGYEKQKVGYFFFSLIPLRFLELLKEKLIDKEPEAKGIGSWKDKPVDSAIKNFLVFDFKVSQFLRKIGFKFPGLSNYIVCNPK